MYDNIICSFIFYKNCSCNTQRQLDIKIFENFYKLNLIQSLTDSVK